MALQIGFMFFVTIILFSLLIAAVGVYNALISLNKQVSRAWANIDVILKQRFDLVPQLISICEQFTQYERSTLDHVIQARTKYAQGGDRHAQIQADKEMTVALKGIFAVGEAYPVLKSSEQFVQIQNTLTSLESQLADRREMYNEAVTNFNTRIAQIPDVFFARLLGFNEFELYKVAEFEKAMPSIKMKLPAA